MATSNTYDVIHLGTAADLDPTETGSEAENASLIVGTTFGSVGAPLHENTGVMSPVGNPGGKYLTNNSSANDQFSIDGGPAQTFDSVVIYNATITYVDGTTATITAVVFQDTDGELYLAPEVVRNSDQDALEAGPIRSLTIDSIAQSFNQGLTVQREAPEYVCYARGTKISTIAGQVAVEDLKAGDLVLTLDKGYQEIRWIGSQKVPGSGKTAPVRIAAETLGNDRDLWVSQQHRMLIRGGDQNMAPDGDDFFVPAKKLVNGSSIRIEECHEVEYFHILLDEHHIIFAEGCPSESFYLGSVGWGILTDKYRAEIKAVLPELFFDPGSPPDFGDTARPHISRKRDLTALSPGGSILAGIS